MEYTGQMWNMNPKASIDRDTQKADKGRLRKPKRSLRAPVEPVEPGVNAIYDMLQQLMGYEVGAQTTPQGQNENYIDPQKIQAWQEQSGGGMPPITMAPDRAPWQQAQPSAPDKSALEMKDMIIAMRRNAFGGSPARQQASQLYSNLSGHQMPNITNRAKHREPMMDEDTNYTYQESPHPNTLIQSIIQDLVKQYVSSVNPVSSQKDRNFFGRFGMKK